MYDRRGWRLLTAMLIVVQLIGGMAVAAGDDTIEPDAIRIMPADARQSDDDRSIIRGESHRPGLARDPIDEAYAIETYAQEHLAATFAGLYLTRNGDDSPATIVVAFTETPDQEREQALQALAGDAEIIFRVVDFSLAELQAKQREIERHMSDLESRGVEIATIGVDAMANRVKIGVTANPAAAEAILAEQFGSDMLEVVEQERPQLMPGSEEPDDSARQGLFQRIIDWFRSWWSRWFN